MARTNAPTPNCGFMIDGEAGWVRLWLLNDDPNRSSGDLYAIPGVFYPLSVASYELGLSIESPSSLVFNETSNLGGYTRSQGLDESPYSDLPANVGFYSGDSGSTVELTPRGVSTVAVSLSPGEFYAQDIESVDVANYLLLVMP